LTEILEAEIAAAIRKFIGEHGALYYQHVNELAHEIMLPVGHAVARLEAEARPVVEKVETKVEQVATEVKVEAEHAITTVEAEVEKVVKKAAPKRSPRKKAADEGSGD
jgi:hypothetical protein